MTNTTKTVVWPYDQATLARVLGLHIHIHMCVCKVSVMSMSVCKVSVMSMSACKYATFCMQRLRKDSGVPPLQWSRETYKPPFSISRSFCSCKALPALVAPKWLQYKPGPAGIWTGDLPSLSHNHWATCPSAYIPSSRIGLPKNWQVCTIPTPAITTQTLKLNNRHGEH